MNSTLTIPYEEDISISQENIEQVLEDILSRDNTDEFVNFLNKYDYMLDDLSNNKIFNMIVENNARKTFVLFAEELFTKQTIAVKINSYLEYAVQLDRVDILNDCLQYHVPGCIQISSLLAESLNNNSSNCIDLLINYADEGVILGGFYSIISSKENKDADNVLLDKLSSKLSDELLCSGIDVSLEYDASINELNKLDYFIANLDKDRFKSIYEKSDHIYSSNKLPNTKARFSKLSLNEEISQIVQKKDISGKVKKM